MSSVSGAKSRQQKEKDPISSHVSVAAVSPSPEKQELPKADSSKKSSKQIAKLDVSRPRKKKKEVDSDHRTAEERQADLAELAEILPEETIDDGVFLVDYIVAERKNRKGRLEYLIKWKGYSDAQNTWEPAGNILTPQLLEEFEKRKATDPSGVAEAAMSKSSKSKQSTDPDAAQKKNKKNKKAPASSSTTEKPGSIALSLSHDPNTTENAHEPEPKADSPKTDIPSPITAAEDPNTVSTLVDGIQFIESTVPVNVPAKKQRAPKPTARKEFTAPTSSSQPPTRARASALTAKLLLSEGLQRDEGFEDDISQKHVLLSPLSRKRSTGETWSSSHAHILLAPQPPQENGQHIPLSSAAATAAIARRDVSLLIEKNADLLRRANFVNAPGVEALEVGVPRTVEDAVRQSLAAPEKDSRPFILENNGNFTADEWAQLSRVLMELGFATISDFNSKMILATKPVLQNFQYFKELLQPQQRSSLASTSSLHSSATSPSASTSDLLAGSLINLAAIQQRVPDHTKKN